MPDPDRASPLQAAVKQPQRVRANPDYGLTFNTTTYIYDGLGRLCTDTNQLGKTRAYQYDAAGNQIETIDRNGLDQVFEYDTLNRLTKENWMSAGTVTRSFISQYDVLDRLIDVTDQTISGGTATKVSEYSYTYDDLDRIRAIDNLGVGGVARVALNYSYDQAGNLTSVTDTINGTLSGTTSYDYDALDRTTQITQSGAGITNKGVRLSYNAIRQMETMQRLTGTTFNQSVATTTYAYTDPLNRLTQIAHTSATGSGLASYALDYDNGSRIRKIQNADLTSVTYNYAKNDELAAADYTNRTDEAYTYDANGNRTNTGYVTGVNNQLTSDGTYTYTYDDEGNLKTRTGNGSTRTFTWDYRNRLTSVVENSVTLGSYAYDASNQRISKTISDTTTRFVYDRGNVALESNGTGATPTVRYFYGTQVDQILAQDKGSGNVSWMLTDQLGSVRALVGNDGTVRNRFEYDAFGTVASTMTNATDTSRYQYTGREWDGETGLYYYRARYYDSRNGRFVGQDPIGFEAGDANLYRYVENKVTSYRDPSGKIKVYYLFSDVGQVDLPGGVRLKAGQNHVDLYIQTEKYSLTLGFDPDRDGTRNGSITYKVPLRDNFADNPVRSPGQMRQDQEFQRRQMQLIYEDKSDPKCETPKNKGLIRRFQNEGIRIHHAMIPYRFASTNSNAAMYTALTRVAQEFSGLKVQKPKYSAPGWGINVYTYEPPDKIIYG